MERTVANFGDHQDSSPFIDYNEDDEDEDDEDDEDEDDEDETLVSWFLSDDSFEVKYVADIFAIVRLFTPTYASSCPIEV
jgi:hypothetical protein